MDQPREDLLSRRKIDHIEMAFDAFISVDELDRRFTYEPLFCSHPGDDGAELKKSFLGKTMDAPLWISSMTGGAKEAFMVNQVLARSCVKHGLGMGLGSIRPLLEDHVRFQDFNLRPILGASRPFYGNLGVAQIEASLENKKVQKIHDLVQSLELDGLIIHVNPLQEFLQPEGDRFKRPPIEVIEEFLELSPYKVIVKEVGQGMGPRSLTALGRLPLAAIELAAFGGTNFSKLELMRGDKSFSEAMENFTKVGHSAEEMITHLNKMIKSGDSECQNIIISGGVRSLLDGYYLMSKYKGPSVIGMASLFLKFAKKGEAELNGLITTSKKALSLARSVLVVKESVD